MRDEPKERLRWRLLLSDAELHISRIEFNSPFYSCVLGDPALAESEAGVDIYISKELRFVSKRGQPQPRF